MKIFYFKNNILRTNLFRVSLILFILFVLGLLCYFSPIHLSFKIRDMMIGCLSGGFVLLANYSINHIHFSIFPETIARPNIVISQKLNRVLKSNLFIFLSTIFVALTEELIFRSYLLSLTNKYFPIIISIIINAIVFSLLHFNSKIVQLMFMAIIFSLITIYTDNLLPAIIAHFVNNYLSHIYKNKKK